MENKQIEYAIERRELPNELRELMRNDTNESYIDFDFLHSKKINELQKLSTKDRLDEIKRMKSLLDAYITDSTIE